MKNLLFTFFTLASIFLNGQTNSQTKKENGISFTENKGQIRDQNYRKRSDILFTSSNASLTFHVRANGMNYQQHKQARNNNVISVYRVELDLLNTNSNIAIETDLALPGFTNYFLKGCENGITGVKSYSGFSLKNIYQNIDIHYYSNGSNLKYDFIVKPGADYKKIKIQVKGAVLKLMKDGSLLLTTPLGKINEHAPLVFQGGKQLKSKFVLSDNNIVSFDIENVDALKELIIDPEVRVWGTYYGGTGTDEGNDCTRDAQGHIFIAGFTSGPTTTAIATVGSHQINFNGSNDAFLAKFDSTGTRLWATYYGDSGNDIATACANDKFGNVYISGTSSGSTGTLIATPGSHQTTIGGNSDAFLAKFDPNGIRIWSTYYGGANNDDGYDCAIDTSKNVYLCGRAGNSSGTVIATPGSHQATYGGSNWDAFLVKFDSNGVRQWGTWYGGVAFDYGRTCTVDKLNNVFLAGFTGSTGSSIATPGTFQPLQGYSDAFLVKFNSSGVRQWGTFFGGGNYEYAYGLSADTSNNIYMTGETGGSFTGFPTFGAHQINYGGGTNDGFLAKFNSSGGLLFGTFYGGSGSDVINSVKTENGFVYIGGTTNSTGSISTASSYQPGVNNTDAFLVKFNTSGVRQWGSYYGGGGTEAGKGITSFNNRIYLTGSTSTSTATTVASLNSHQPAFGGTQDAFLAKFYSYTCANINISLTANNPVCSSGNLSLTATPNTTAQLNYSWTGPNGFNSSVQNPVIIGVNPSNAGNYSLSVTSDTNCPLPTIPINITVQITPTLTVSSGSICVGDSYTINANGAQTYTLPNWNGVVSPIATTIYTLSGANDPCSVNATSTVYVISNPTISVSTSNSVICSGSSVTLTASGASSYSWVTGEFTSVITPTLINPGYFTVYGSNYFGCTSSVSFIQSVSPCTAIEENSLEEFIQLFPNPAHSEFFLKIAYNCEVEVYNNLLQKITTYHIPSGLSKITLNEYARGVYIIKILDKNQRNRMVKLIVQ